MFNEVVVTFMIVVAAGLSGCVSKEKAEMLANQAANAARLEALNECNEKCAGVASQNVAFKARLEKLKQFKADGSLR
jgi:hypothetical protein